MTVTLHEAPVGATLTNKHLIGDQLWERLVCRIVKDEEMDRSLAERIMDQALGFLQLIASVPDKAYSPSPLVDIGWHTFILHTRAYAAFCEKVKRGFIHHEPTDQEGSVNRTVEALRAHGLTVDEGLWASATCCSDSVGPQCH